LESVFLYMFPCKIALKKMVKLKINLRIDRYNQRAKNDYINSECQVLRFDSKYNLIATISHTETIKLRNKLDEYIKKNKLKGITNEN